MLACLAGLMASDRARVLIIDTDPQRSCVEWAEEQEIRNLDVVSHLAEDTLLDLIDNVDSRYDTILIDTAGYDSRMATYVIQASDLILIPTGGSKKDVLGAVRTWKHATTLTAKYREPPEVRIALWNVKRTTNVFQHARAALEQAGIPILQSATASLTGFNVMSWNGGLPSGAAAVAIRSFAAALQIENLLSFYAGENDDSAMERHHGHA